MKAVILCGGHRVPRCPLAMVRPRPLFPLPVGTLLDWLLIHLRQVGTTHAILCLDRASRPFGGDLESPKVLVHEEPLPRGPAGCLRDVADLVGRETFIVVEGGLFLTGNLQPVVAHHRRQGAALTLAAVPADQWERSNGGNGHAPPLAPLGLYVVEPCVLDHIPRGGFFDIKEQLIPRLQAQGLKVATTLYPGGHRRVRDARSYAALVHELLAEGFAQDRPAELHEPHPQVWLAKGARVDTTATVVGPVALGPGAVIGPHAVVTGPTLLGERAVVCENAFVNNSILWPGARIGARAFVEHSIVTDNFTVPDNSRLSHSIALDRTLRLGDLHGLRIGGYHVAPLHAASRNGTSRLAPAIRNIWKSVKTLW